MNNDNFHIWKIKHELATEGSYQAIQQIKQQVLTKSNDLFQLSQISFYDLLKNSKIHFLPKGQTYAQYQTYKQTPLFLVLDGVAQIKFINLQADTETHMKAEGKGVLGVDTKNLQEKYTKSNLNLLTQFELVAEEDCILIQTKEKGGQNRNKKQQISQKELNILKKLMIFPSKQVTKVKVSSTTSLKDRFYLLSGKACYFLNQPESKIILVCYAQGYINPKQFQESSKISLYVFQDSEILYLQQNFLKDQYAKAIEMKRESHVNEIKKKYKAMKAQQINKIQQKLILKYRLPHKIVDTKIYGKKVKQKQDLNQSQKKPKSKTDLISTSSSIKCAIRIRKSKKIN